MQIETLECKKKTSGGNPIDENSCYRSTGDFIEFEIKGKEKWDSVANGYECSASQFADFYFLTAEALYGLRSEHVTQWGNKQIP